MENKSTAQIIGDNLKRYRLEVGMKQKEFAEKIGMNYQNYSQTERGLYKPSLDKLMDISKELNLSPNHLLLEQGNKNLLTDAHSRIDFVKSRMNVFEPLRKKANDAREKGNEEEEKKYLLELINDLAWKNEHYREIADYLYYKSLNDEIKKASESYQKVLNETGIDKFKRLLKKY